MRFTIKNRIGGTKVNIDDEFDKMLCSELKLEYNHLNPSGEKDYGHFYFPDKEEVLKEKGWAAQKSISWVGILDTVIYYSKIKSGPVTRYEIESACAWCMKYSITFPASVRVFISRFMDFIDEKGYIIEVDGHDVEPFEKEAYVNLYSKNVIRFEDNKYVEYDDEGKPIKSYNYGKFNKIRCFRCGRYTSVLNTHCRYCNWMQDSVVRFRAYLKEMLLDDFKCSPTKYMVSDISRYFRSGLLKMEDLTDDRGMPKDFFFSWIIQYPAYWDNFFKNRLLAGMQREPGIYSRNDIYSLIYSGLLTKEDLINETAIITEKAFNHIMKYPTLSEEQGELKFNVPVDSVNRQSGTDIYFLGAAGANMNLLLAQLFCYGELYGFHLNPSSSDSAVEYALGLIHYAQESKLPPESSNNQFQLVKARIITDRRCKFWEKSSSGFQEKSVSLICLPEINISDIENHSVEFDRLLRNENRKLIFFVLNIDNPDYRQRMILEKMIDLTKNVEDKISNIGIILTTKYKYIDSINTIEIKELLKITGLADIIGRSLFSGSYSYDHLTIKDKIKILPYRLGKFMPGEVYTYEETGVKNLVKLIDRGCAGKAPELRNPKPLFLFLKRLGGLFDKTTE